MYDDGTPGEIFVKIAKEGTVVSGLMDSLATVTSIALQYGVPLKALTDKFSHTRFEPSGVTGNPEIPIAKSIMDYIGRWLAKRYLPADELAPGAHAAGGIADLMQASALSAAAPAVGPAGKEAANDPLAGGPGRGIAFQAQLDAPPCPECGSMMTRNGSCYRCINCGTTSGCS
jgi:ribonucleoside-diphosphate reductase alpha chain